MRKPPAIPKYLYKYKPFSELLLKELAFQEVYYCKPQQFNDPLDCRPLLADDLDLKHLERLAFQLLKRKKPDDRDWAVSEMNQFRYSASEFGRWNDGKEGERSYRYDLNRVVEEDLISAMGDIGVLSLSKKWDSILMWSHYASNHRGICLEFAYQDNRCDELLPVDYGSPRGISMKDVYRWRLRDETEAGKRIRHAFVFTKAHEWRYEAEWRATQTPSGSAASPFHLKSILFGERCDPSIIMTIVKLFSDGQVSPRFYDVYLDNERTKLKRRISDTGEFEAFGVRKSAIFQHEEIMAMFDDLSEFEDLAPDLPADDEAAAP